MMCSQSNKVVKLHTTLQHFNKQIKITTFASVDAFKQMGQILFYDLTKLSTSSR